MAYRQPHDPYHQQRQQQQQQQNYHQPYSGQHTDNYNHAANPAPGQYYQAPANGQYLAHDAQSDWDGKSRKSFESRYAGSEAHLNPSGGYEMSQVPLPAVSYNQNQPNYPPMPPPPQQGYGQDQYLRPGMASRSDTGYSAAREKMMRRRSVRQVELQQGNLILDLEVPSNIVPTGSTSEETTHVRYTAATCDPDDFARSKYSLRPFLYGRQTELFIVMTMYLFRYLNYKIHRLHVRKVQ
jgi:chitin synthase